MSDTISRQAAIDALAKNMPALTTPDGCGELDHDIQVTDEAYVDCMQIIQELPSAQPKTGKWEIYVISMFDGEGCRCSECGFEGVPYWDYCPYCGCHMLEEGEKT